MRNIRSQLPVMIHRWIISASFSPSSSRTDYRSCLRRKREDGQAEGGNERSCQGVWNAALEFGLIVRENEVSPSPEKELVDSKAEVTEDCQEEILGKGVRRMGGRNERVMKTRGDSLIGTITMFGRKKSFRRVWQYPTFGAAFSWKGRTAEDFCCL